MTVDKVSSERLARPLIIDVVIDVNDLATMSAFWQAMLGYERAFEGDAFCYLLDPSGRGPHVFLQVVPEPRQEKNRLHLDIVVPSMADDVERFVEAGATRVDERRTAFTWFVVLADPEGNQFCLVDLATWEQSQPPWWQHGVREG
jgi:predicted enzyme related to lactoylglutathione lyase